MRTLRVALVGCGVVGSQVAKLLHEQADELSARVGAHVSLAGIAVRDVSRERDLPVAPELFTSDAMGLVSRDDVDVVVELIGGVDTAQALITTAMEHGASVVTANKELLAANAVHLHEVAEKHGVDVYYEAAVAGAIPLLRPLRESLAGDHILRVMGIVNGTTNYILDQMDSVGAGFTDALNQARECGYAEADPTADIEGFDAAAKAAILAGIAFHTPVVSSDVYREGISAITEADVALARDMDSVIKPLVMCERVPDSSAVSVRTHPAMLPRSHPLASVRGAFNAVFVEAESAGQLMFYGQGAGGVPTASAVLGDVVAAARHRLGEVTGSAGSWYADRPIERMEEVVTRYHIRLDVDDRPGVLAAVAAVFAKCGVSIETVRQRIVSGNDAELVVVTHHAREAALRATVSGLATLDVVQEVASVLRVEGEPSSKSSEDLS